MILNANICRRKYHQWNPIRIWSVQYRGNGWLICPLFPIAGEASYSWIFRKSLHWRNVRTSLLFYDNRKVVHNHECVRRSIHGQVGIHLDRTTTHKPQFWSHFCRRTPLWIWKGILLQHYSYSHFFFSLSSPAVER